MEVIKRMKMGRDKVENAEELEAKWGPKAENAEELEARRNSKEEVEETGESWEHKTERAEQREKESGQQIWQEEKMQEKNSNHMKRKAIKKDKRKAEFEYEDIDKKQRKTEYRISGTMAAKVIAFFLLVISCAIGLCGGGTIIYMYQVGAYTSGQNEFLQTMLYKEARNITYRVQSQLAGGNVENAEIICQEHNIDLELVKEEGGEEIVVWSTWNGYGTSLRKEDKYPHPMENSPFTEIFVYFNDMVAIRNIVVNDHVLKPHEEYIFRIYLDTEFSKEDNLKKTAERASFLYQTRFQLIGITVGCLFLCFVCFIFLMCSAGHRAGYKGIVPGVLTNVHLDILTAVFGGVSILVIRLICEIGRYGDESLLDVLMAIILVTFLVFWGVLYLTDIAVRLKRGKVLRHTLVFEILCWLGKGIRFLGKGLLLLSSHISSVIATISICLGICILEFFVILIMVENGEIGLFFWVMEKLILLAIAVYITFNYKQLLQASDALAEGGEDYVVDTSKMIGDFKRHGENLNSIGRGISKAVAERMKSEHLKTELITNVSHDLKTPLTSIINYADLICEETANISGEDEPGMDHTKVAEYAEVLLRQSRRLKKLLEDLVEASKATTGNLEVNLEPCETGVILSQAVGEYEKRMEEKGLKLITRQPEEPVYIIADGKHLWRVFDNLLNNICKYAQENSRVYLSVETKDEYVMIVFRNMSKYPLELSAEELQERFIRGDKSRHMEGNGLGLSIAGSLIELQNGKMDIVTDGDLFKVVLQFLRDNGS